MTRRRGLITFAAVIAGIALALLALVAMIMASHFVGQFNLFGAIGILALVAVLAGAWKARGGRHA